MLHSEEQARMALELYMETRSTTRTIRQLDLKVSHSHVFYKWTDEVQGNP